MPASDASASPHRAPPLRAIASPAALVPDGLPDGLGAMSPADAPDTLAAFDAWLAAAQAKAFRQYSPHPALPSGPEKPQIMLISDFPDESPDVSGLPGQPLFGGEQGRLVAAMLAAIGLDITAQRLASIAMTRPLARRLSATDIAALLPLLHKQIALVQPKSLLLLGSHTSDAMLGRSFIPPAENQPFFNHINPKTAIFAIHHPRMLLERPQLKRHAWEVLKRIKESF